MARGMFVLRKTRRTALSRREPIVLQQAMDFIDIGYVIALCFIPIIAHILFFKQERQSRYSSPTWYYVVKWLLSINVIRNYMKSNRVRNKHDVELHPKKLTADTEEDVHVIFGNDQKGNTVYIKIATRLNKHAEVVMSVRLENGQVFDFPGKQLLYSMEKREWTAGGLSIVCLEPYKKLKLDFNEFVKLNNQMVPRNFQLLWTGASAPIFYPHDYESGLFSDAVSREPWRDGNWMKLLGDRVGYEQYGTLEGSFFGISVNIPTIRKHYWGTSDRLALYRDFGVFLATEDGLLLNVGARSVRAGCTHLRYGSVLHGNGRLRSITDNDISLQYIGEYKDVPEAFTVHVNTNMSSIKCVFHVHCDDQRRIINDESRGWELITARAECTANARSGKALLMFWYNRKGKGVTLPVELLRPLREVSQTTKLAFSLKDDEAKMPSVVGSNVANLGLLTSLKDAKFTVPEGFILAGEAFRRHVEDNEALREALVQLQMVVFRNDFEEMKVVCDRIVDLFSTTKVSQDISDSISAQFYDIEKKTGKCAWTVWYSDVIVNECLDSNGEWKIENPSFQCNSLEEVQQSVLKCWANFYSYLKVLHRRKNGVPVRSGITIIVQVKITGNKNGTFDKHCPLREDLESIRQVKLQVVSRLGRWTEVDWIMKENTIYIASCNDGSMWDEWSSNNLEHELDDAIISEKGIYSTSNTNEIMPGALTVLSNTVVCSLLGNGLDAILEGKTNSTTIYALVCRSHHIFTDVLSTIWSVAPRNVGLKTAAADLAFFGRIITDSNVLNHAIAKNGLMTPFKVIGLVVEILKSTWTAESSLKKAEALSNEEICFRKNMSLREIHGEIDRFLDVCGKIGELHVATSRANLIYQWLTFLMIASDGEEFTPKHYSDIALILSANSDVSTAEVPSYLDKIASIVRNSGLGEAFSNVEPSEGAEWLRLNIPDAFAVFEQFIEKHGHRSFKEYELMDRCWRDQKDSIISIVQKIWKLKRPPKIHRVLSVEETADKLKTTRSRKARILLEFLIGKCRKMISYRERTKSCLVVAINKLRTGYDALADKMVAEEHLPDKTCIYHLTKYELMRLVEERNHTLVGKACVRRHDYKEWNEFYFPEIMHGIPKEVYMFDTINNENDSFKGTPVCFGEVTARCCNVTSLDDVQQLQQGDILVARSVDFRLSLYFPILAGVVIELGGFISYGAVSAREYGIPCLVGVKDVTRLVETGQTLKLSTTMGLVQIQKLPEAGP